MYTTPQCITGALADIQTTISLPRLIYLIVQLAEDLHVHVCSMHFVLSSTYILVLVGSPARTVSHVVTALRLQHTECE